MQGHYQQRSTQQNLIIRPKMISDKSQRSLSPINKDALSIGKLIKLKRQEEQNPEHNQSQQYGKINSTKRDKSPKSIGINTSHRNIKHAPIITTTSVSKFVEHDYKPITHLKQPVSEGNLNMERPQHPYLMNQIGVNSLYSNNVENRVPAVVDFPDCYHQDCDNQQLLPETPDLPNRMSHRNQAKQSQKQPLKVQLESKTGTIRHQLNSRIFSNSAPKDFGTHTTQTEYSSPQLPHIKKIDSNINGFRKFIKNDYDTQITRSFSEVEQPKIGKKYQIRNQQAGRKNNLNKSNNKSVYSSKHDPEQQSKLQQRKNFKISSNNFHISRLKLPTFKEQNKDQFEQQVDLDGSRLSNSNNVSINISTEINKVKIKDKSAMVLNNSYVSHFAEQQPEFVAGTLFSNSFLKSPSYTTSASTLHIDLRTSLQKLKQCLIQTQEALFVNFTLPPLFFQPPTYLTTSSQLHHTMMTIFNTVGIQPQIVSIKKYINCVVMRDAKLCILWYFNGKIYFGGWKNKDSIGGDGNKDGIGIEWVPSRFVYYGEFKDNKKEGYGIMKKASKEVYLGCWKNNQRWGWGKAFDPEGNLHQNGQFIEGCFVYPKKQSYSPNKDKRLEREEPKVSKNRIE